ncbi:MAG: hypothetical protein ACLQBY_14935 [Solirubrobacteraceae bacterium]
MLVLPFTNTCGNIVRGILAEFLVAQAVGDPSLLREAWDNWDVTTVTGIKVEVKSSAYLQSWNQRKLSSIVFTGVTGRAWSADTNELAAERSLRAEVYGLCAPHLQGAGGVRPGEDRPGAATVRPREVRPRDDPEVVARAVRHGPPPSVVATPTG